VHEKVTPYGGGAAMFVGFCLALLVAFAIPSLRTIITSSHEMIGVLLAAGNAVGGYAVTERMLEMFKSSGARGSGRGGGAKGTH